MFRQIDMIYVLLFLSGILHNIPIYALWNMNVINAPLPLSLWLFSDHWVAKRFHTSALSRGIPRRLSSDGADGCQPVPSDPDGFGPWANVLLALPNAMWHQTSSLCWNNPQGKFFSEFP